MNAAQASSLEIKYQYLVGKPLENMHLVGYSIIRIMAYKYPNGEYDVNWYANTGFSDPNEIYGSLSGYCKANGIEYPSL